MCRPPRRPRSSRDRPAGRRPGASEHGAVERRDLGADRALEHPLVLAAEDRLVGDELAGTLDRALDRADPLAAGPAGLVPVDVIAVRDHRPRLERERAAQQTLARRERQKAGFLAPSGSPRSRRRRCRSAGAGSRPRRRERGRCAASRGRAAGRGGCRHRVRRRVHRPDRRAARAHARCRARGRARRSSRTCRRCRCARRRSSAGRSAAPARRRVARRARP